MVFDNLATFPEDISEGMQSRISWNTIYRREGRGIQRTATQESPVFEATINMESVEYSRAARTHDFFNTQRGGLRGFRLKDWGFFTSARDNVTAPDPNDDNTFEVCEHISGNQIYQLVKRFTNRTSNVVTFPITKPMFTWTYNIVNITQGFPTVIELDQPHGFIPGDHFFLSLQNISHTAIGNLSILNSFEPTSTGPSVGNVLNGSVNGFWNVVAISDTEVELYIDPSSQDTGPYILTDARAYRSTCAVVDNEWTETFPDSLIVKVNGTALTPVTDYVIDHATGRLTLTAAVNAGDVVTAAFMFHLPMMFAPETDSAFQMLTENDAIDIQQIDFLSEPETEEWGVDWGPAGGYLDHGNLDGGPAFVTMSIEDGALQRWEVNPSSSSFTIILPPLSGRAFGDQQTAIHIDQAQAFTVSIARNAEDGGGVIGTIPGGSTRQLYITNINNAGTRDWMLV